jgi:RNA polymerase sigma-70 factor (ECF subfamily)
VERAEKIPMNISAGAASDSVNESARTEPSDREAVERCQRGDIAAYEILVNRYRARVYTLVYGMLRNEQDATDVAQETFVRGWRAIRSFKKNASFYTWLYRIATNQCIDFVRKRDRRPTTTFEEAIDPDTDADVHEPPSTNPQPTDEIQRKELRAQIDAALRELSPEHRAVIHLREFEGLDYAGIAKTVGCSLGTVMSRLHYARKHLQKLLKEQL